MGTATRLVAPMGGRLVWAQSHLHTGGVNATLSLESGSSATRSRKILCTTGTRYGSETDPSQNARNEQNHLIRIDSCYDPIGEEHGIRFEKGDVLVLETDYYGASDDPRLVSIDDDDESAAGGEHKN